MSYWPETRDELIERFTTDDDLQHREMFVEFIDSALSRPNPRYLNLLRDGIQVPNMTASDLASTICDHSMVFPGFAPNGWVDADGKFWTCEYAAHERLLELMDMNSIEQEYEGWVKVQQCRVHARYLPNNVQMQTLNRLDNWLKEIGRKLDLAPLRDLPQLKKSRYSD